MGNNIKIKVIEEQSEENHPCELSQDEIDMFLNKYKCNNKKEQRIPCKPIKRLNNDLDTQKSNSEYYETRYNNIDIGDNKVFFKIEIKSDMKL